MAEQKSVPGFAWLLLGVAYVWVAYELVKLPPMPDPYRHCVELGREYTGKTRSNGKASTSRETVKHWQCPDGMKIEVTYTR